MAQTTNATQVRMTGRTKTHEAWEGSLIQYLDIGDAVDEAIWWHMLEVLPPRTQDADLMQAGGARDHRGSEGRARYGTFQRFAGVWYWTGVRVAGERVTFMAEDAS